VKLSFVLDEMGTVASVDVLSGDPSLRGGAAAVVKSWKFQLPANLFRTEWRYETTFDYSLSGRELESGQAARLVVTFDSFHRIGVVSDAFKPITEIQVVLPPMR
jgi:hypothetical protein